MTLWVNNHFIFTSHFFIEKLLSDIKKCSRIFGKYYKKRGYTVHFYFRFKFAYNNSLNILSVTYSGEESLIPKYIINYHCYGT